MNTDKTAIKPLVHWSLNGVAPIQAVSGGEGSHSINSLKN